MPMVSSTEKSLTPWHRTSCGSQAASSKNGVFPVPDSEYDESDIWRLRVGEGNRPRGHGRCVPKRHRGLERVVALKMLISGSLASEKEITRFQTEGGAASAGFPASYVSTTLGNARRFDDVDRSVETSRNPAPKNVRLVPKLTTRSCFQPFPNGDVPNDRPVDQNAENRFQDLETRFCGQRPSRPTRRPLPQPRYSRQSWGSPQTFRHTC